MADIMSRATRSALMSRIRSRDTKPERELRSALRRAGLRYRSYRTIRGVRVDAVIPAQRIAILVHGCFWHGCRLHYTAPHDNAEFWRAKLGTNRARDRRQLKEIRFAGWTPVVIWEHALRANPDTALRRALGGGSVTQRS